MKEESDEAGGLTMRLLKAGETLLHAHAEHAKEEARRDLGRIVSGVVLVATAALVVALALLALQVLAVLALREHAGLAWLHAVGVLAVADLVLALLLGLVGRARLRRPVLRETRKTLKQAIVVLRG